MFRPLFSNDLRHFRNQNNLNKFRLIFGLCLFIINLQKKDLNLIDRYFFPLFISNLRFSKKVDFRFCEQLEGRFIDLDKICPLHNNRKI